MGIKVFHADTDGVPIPIIANQARLIVWPGVGAQQATMNRVLLEPGEANVPHTHPQSEDTIFILEGRGVAVDLTHNEAHQLEAGMIVHVPAGVQHVVKASPDSTLLSVGGPAPPDFELLRACGLRWA